MNQPSEWLDSDWCRAPDDPTQYVRVYHSLALINSVKFCATRTAGDFGTPLYWVEIDWANGQKTTHTDDEYRAFLDAWTRAKGPLIDPLSEVEESE